MILTNEPIHYDFNVPQLYHCIICHKPSPCLDMFQDYSNKLFLTDKNVEGAIDCSSPWDSAKFGEFPFYSWIAQNFRPQDWVCVHHYRRKGSLGLGNLVPEPIQINGSMAEHVAYYHSPVLADAIMKTLTPLEQSLFTTTKMLYAYNILCLNVGLIQQLYFPYIANKIMLLESILGRNYVPDPSFFVERPGKRTDTWYQNRIYGFAMERYTTLWILQNQDKINGTMRIKLLEPEQQI